MTQSIWWLGLAGMGCNGDLDLESHNYFVKLSTDGADVADSVQQIANQFAIEPIHVYDSATEGFTAKIADVIAGDLENLEDVESVTRDDEKSILIPDEASDIVLGDDEVPEGMLRIGGPYLGGADFLDVHVAIVDTGIDSGHSELNVVEEADLVGERTGEFADGGDPNGHGTHVAGTLGARGDGAGVVGVAPGVPLHAVRVLDAQGSGTYGDIIAGLEYVLEHPEIQVVNMSLGGASSADVDEMLSEPLERLEDAGVIVCIAAGNDGEDTKDFTPAGLDYGIVVSAYDASGGDDNGFAYFSNFGDAVDIAAPGVDIMSTWPGGEFDALSGTSMATPHVAGAMAIYRALEPNTTVADARAAVIASGEEGLSGAGGDHGEPLLDLAALVSAAGG
jgi:subtilisin